MDVFKLRGRLIADFAGYVRSFIQIADEGIRRVVDFELDRGLLWPDPLIQLNPSFEPAETIDELVDEGLLHTECRRIFQRDKDEVGGAGKPLRLHRHQSEAIKVARTGRSYVLTTGTGSGKSLAYIIPIVDHVLRRGAGQGIQAIVVYPMNALANSQAGELEKFLYRGYPSERPPVRFARYTGQESEEDHQAIIANPPDILLTNYVMLELLLTRPRERTLIQAARGLRFLVLDELHVYRGRQKTRLSVVSAAVEMSLGAVADDASGRAWSACSRKEVQSRGDRHCACPRRLRSAFVVHWGGNKHSNYLVTLVLGRAAATQNPCAAAGSHIMPRSHGDH